MFNLGIAYGAKVGLKLRLVWPLQQYKLNSQCDWEHVEKISCGVLRNYTWQFWNNALQVVPFFNPNRLHTMCPYSLRNDCEPLLQSRYACLYNLEPNFMPCLALHHFFASSNLLIDSHHFVTFLNKQEAIVASAVMIRCISWIPNRSNLIIRFEQGDSWCWLHCDRFCVTISLITVARYMVFQSLFSSKR